MRKGIHWNTFTNTFTLIALLHRRQFFRDVPIEMHLPHTLAQETHLNEEEAADCGKENPQKAHC